MTHYDPPIGASSVKLVTDILKLYQRSAEKLASVINDLEEKGAADGKAVGTAVKDLRAAFGWALEERNNVEKIAKSLAAAAGPKDGYDLAAARSEIGGRLARLRSANDGRGISDQPK